jgi:Zn-dependent peptidase ImmA (M78 family)
MQDCLPVDPRYNLHAPPGAIVDIRSVAYREGWHIVEDWRMKKLWGLARADVQRIWLKATLSPAYKRAVIAHELGHWLCGHFDSGVGLECCTQPVGFAGWLIDRQERQAWHAAAKILIPWWVVNECDGDPEQIAAMADVPRWLVGMLRRR